MAVRTQAKGRCRVAGSKSLESGDERRKLRAISSSPPDRSGQVIVDHIHLLLRWRHTHCGAFATTSLDLTLGLPPLLSTRRVQAPDLALLGLVPSAGDSVGLPKSLACGTRSYPECGRGKLTYGMPHAYGSPQYAALERRPPPMIVLGVDSDPHLLSHPTHGFRGQRLLSGPDRRR